MYSISIRCDFDLGWAREHKGTPQDFVDRYRVVANQAATKGVDYVNEQIVPGLVACIADDRNLRCAWDYLTNQGGNAPGPNGLTFRDLRGPEIWQLMRVLSAAIKDGTYRPGPVREVQIPKGPGRGTRTLTIANIEDRVVQRAVLQGVQPLLDPFFSPFSFGGRPRRGCVDALAVAAVTAQSDDRWCWISVDIRNAFDNVPLSRLLDLVRKRLPCDGFVQLAKKIVGPGRKRGIPQGGPLSSLLLNIYLDHFLDRRWTEEFPEVPLLRFVDDILILCRASDVSRALTDRLTEMLRTCGMPIRELSDQRVVRNLAGADSVNWLGFVLCKEGTNMAARLEPGWAEQLQATLLLAHEKNLAPIRARTCIEGWLGAIGPAFPHMDRRNVLEEIRLIGRECSFDELPPIKTLNRAWRLSHKRYVQRLAKAVEGHGTGVGLTCAGPPADQSSSSSEPRRRRGQRGYVNDWRRNDEEAPF